MHLELLTKQVCNLSRAVGSYIKDEVNKLKYTDIELKGKNDFVTYVDKESENRLVSELSKVLPEAGFIVEENQELEKAEEFNWIIDPLDGTTNFIHGLPLFSISIALMKNNKIISGVIYEVNSQECFYSWEGGPALLNRNTIKVSENSKINEALIATGFPYSDYSNIDKYIELFKQLIKDSRGVRRLGSAALDLAYVACGRFEAFYEYGLNPWDVAAGSILVEQAGGKLSDFSGSPGFLFGKEIVAANAIIYDKIMDFIKNYFAKSS